MSDLRLVVTYWFSPSSDMTQLYGIASNRAQQQLSSKSVKAIHALTCKNIEKRVRSIQDGPRVLLYTQPTVEDK